MLPSMSAKNKTAALILLALAHAIHANIIYVYLSAQLPPYIHVSLAQTRLFNPKTDIYLIANQAAINLCADLLEKSNIIAVPAESLTPSTYHQQFNASSTLNTTARDGLWKKATERFFYMHELITLHHLQSVIHIESDNMLYVDISGLRDAFFHYAGIGAVLDADNRCIPSIVYIADEKAMTHLVKFMTDNAPKGLNDMQIIAAYRNAFPKNYIDTLPLIMPEYIVTHPLMNAARQAPKNPSQYLNNIKLFKSIFDGAALGQYLGGIDPKNGVSKPGFINETCIFNPSYLTIEWHKDAQGRNIPFAFCNRAKYRINNLHIHSKFLDKFHS